MTRYLGWMLASAALGLSKVLLMAQMLPTAAFGEYAAAMGGVALGVIVLSLGVIEGTIKAFPRLWADGQHTALAGEFVALAKGITWRTTTLTALTAAAGALLLPRHAATLVVLATLIAGISLGGRLVTAVVLATGAVPPLLRVTRFRAISAFVCAAAGAWMGGVTGALVGECIAAVLSLLQGIRLVRGAVGPPVAGEPRQPTVPDHGLYAGTVLTSVTLMSDRMLVAGAANASVAGSYAFAMILAQVGQLFMNILAQRVGPEIIRVTRDRILPPAARHGLTWNALGLVAGTVAVTVGALAARAIGPIGALFEKYAVGAPALALAALVCICMFYSVLEYALIAVNQERTVLAAASAAFVVYVLSFAFVWIQDGGLHGYLGAVLLTRVTHVAWLLAGIRPALRGREGTQ